MTERTHWFLSNEVHVLGYGCWTSKQLLSCWRWLLLMCRSQSLLWPSITRLHPTGCCSLTSPLSTYGDTNCTQASAIFLWSTSEHAKEARAATTSDSADSANSAFHWSSYHCFYLWFPASINLANIFWYYQPELLLRSKFIPVPL